MDPRKKQVNHAEASVTVTNEMKLMALEVKMLQNLFSNDVVKRNTQVRKLPKWFELRGSSSKPFKEEWLVQIWQGLYRTMWLTDDPKEHEGLAERMGHMVDSFGGNMICSLAFFSAFVRTMTNKFIGINKRILDWSLMLISYMLRYTLRLLKHNTWSEELINTFNNIVQQYVLCDSPKSRNLTLHYLDIFIEELAQTAVGDITAAQVAIFLGPFLTFIATQRDGQMVALCRTRVLYYLLYQSALGRTYIENYNRYMEEVSSDEESRVSTSLDPLAYKVNVLIPVLPFDADYVIDELETLLLTNEFTRQRRIYLRKLMKIFETYKDGEFPLGVRTMPKVGVKSVEELLEEKVANFEKMEDEIFGAGGKLKKLSKSKRKCILQVIYQDEAINKALTAELEAIDMRKQSLKKKSEGDEPAAKKSKKDKKVESLSNIELEQPKLLKTDVQPKTMAPTAKMDYKSQRKTLLPAVAKKLTPLEHGKRKILASLQKKQQQHAKIKFALKLIHRCRLQDAAAAERRTLYAKMYKKFGMNAKPKGDEQD